MDGFQEIPRWILRQLIKDVIALIRGRLSAIAPDMGRIKKFFFICIRALIVLPVALIVDVYVTPKMMGGELELNATVMQEAAEKERTETLNKRYDIEGRKVEAIESQSALKIAKRAKSI